MGRGKGIATEPHVRRLNGPGPQLPRVTTALLEQAIARTEARVQILIGAGLKREADKESQRLADLKLCRRPWR